MLPPPTSRPTKNGGLCIRDGLGAEGTLCHKKNYQSLWTGRYAMVGGECGVSHGVRARCYGRPLVLDVLSRALRDNESPRRIELRRRVFCEGCEGSRGTPAAGD